MRRALAGLAAAALIAGCGGGDDEPATTAVETPDEPARTEARERPAARTEPAPTPAPTSGFDPERIYERRSAGVVTVLALGGGRSNLFGRSSESLGSGFVLDRQGYIATNAHVVTSDSGAKARQVYVEFTDANRLSARIVGADANSDIALLKVDPSKLRGPRSKLVPLELGSTAELEVGDPVAAIGSPFGEQQSLSIGVVSALNRDIESLTRFRIGNAIQTDAAINHGNSGGPLLDDGGRVIGINAQIRSTGGGGEGVGFAIPIETAKRALRRLRADGEVEYAYLGVSSVSLYPQLAERLGLDAIAGALVDRVEDGGPADDAGLRGPESRISFQGTPRIPVGGDLIVAVDGRRLTRANDLADVIGTREPGATVSLEIIRDGEPRTLRVRLGERPERPAGR